MACTRPVFGDLTNTAPDGVAFRKKASAKVPSSPAKGDLDTADSVAACAADLCELWTTSASNGGHRVWCLLQKFGNMGPPRFAAILFSPPLAPPPRPSQLNSRLSSTSIPWSLPTLEWVLESWLASQSDIDSETNAALHDLAPSVLQSLHAHSERHRPKASDIMRRLGPEEREQAIMWLFQVCNAVGIQDSVLYLTVLLLDRYCAAAKSSLDLGRLHMLIIAMVGISLKMNGAVDEHSKTPKLQDLLEHLGRPCHTLTEIFKAEHEVLKALRFEVSMPTAAEFLDAYALPFTTASEPDGTSPVHCLARFLLQMSLLDMQMQYRYPHAVLAAGAMYVALWCTQVGPEHFLALLNNVAVCYGAASTS